MPSSLERPGAVNNNAEQKPQLSDQEREKIQKDILSKIKIGESSGNRDFWYNEALALKETNDLTDEDFFFPEVVVELQKQILSNVRIAESASNRDLFYDIAFKIKEKFGISDEQFFTPEVVVELQKQILSNIKIAESASNPNLFYDIAFKIKEKFGISDEQFFTPEVVVELQQNIFSKLEHACTSSSPEIWLASAYRIKDRFNIPDEQFFTPEIIKTAQRQILQTITTSKQGSSTEIYFKSAKKLKDLFRLSDEQFFTPDVMTQIGLIIIEYLKYDWGGKTIKGLLETIQLGEEKVLGVLEPTYIKLMTDGKLKQAESLVELFPVLQIGQSMFSAYSRDIGLAIPSVIEKYVKYTKEENEIALKGLVAKTRSDIESMLSSDAYKGNVKDPVEYKAYIEALYPNNSTSWTSFEQNEKMEDRSQDIAEYKFKKGGYKHLLGQQVEMRLKSGEAAKEDLREQINQPVIEAGAVENLDQELENLTSSSGLELKTREEKLGFLLLESLVGRFSEEKLKALTVKYHFDSSGISAQDLTQNMVSIAENAPNPDYAMLSQYHEFYTDTLKERMRGNLSGVFSKEPLVALLPRYYEDLIALKSSKEHQQEISKLRIDEIGLEGNLTDRLSKILEDKNISLLDENGNPGSKARALAGIITKERQRAARAIELLSGERRSHESIHFGNLSLEDLVKDSGAAEKGTFDAELFEAYLRELTKNLFGKELRIIEKEIGKYETMDGGSGKARSLTMILTKNKPSAHARAVGGVCISGDIQQWNDPSFFQFVLKDSERPDCKGIVMCHKVIDGDKKILTASLNPSSTYLYSVSEEAVFSAIMKSLEEFARENDFDQIAFSDQGAIRTNRTGGGFEKAITDKVKSKNKSVRLSKPRPFSYSRTYNLDSLDVVWEKAS